jgi:hypothetical protein
MAVAKTKVPVWHCRICGRVPVLRRIREVLALRERLGISRVCGPPRRAVTRAQASPATARISPEILVHRDLRTLAWLISLQQK